MDWDALLEDACPNCGEMLDLDSPEENNGLILCSSSACTFRIHEDRKAELCDKIQSEEEGDMLDRLDQE